MAGKVKSSGAKAFVKGGPASMAGKMTTGTQKPGQTAQAGRGSGKFPSGGPGKMAGKSGSRKQKSGVTSQN